MRFLVLLYIQKKLINIKIFKMFQYSKEEISKAFIVHFDCHLGILVEVWFVLPPPYPFSLLAIRAIFNIPQNSY